MRTRLVFASALALVLAIWLVPAASATYGKHHHKHQRATVNVVHGISLEAAKSVDICASGAITNDEFAPVITDLQFTQIEKLYLPAGTYKLKIVGANAGCDTDAAFGLEGEATLEAGANYSIIAYETTAEATSPVALKVAMNDTSKLRGWARVSAYHLADAPAVDIWAAGRDKRSKAIATYGDPHPLFEGVANGAGPASEDVKPNRYKIAIAASPSETAENAVKTLRVKLKRNRNTILYAVGSLDSGTFTVLKQRIKADRHHYSKWGKHGHHKKRHHKHR